VIGQPHAPVGSQERFCFLDAMVVKVSITEYKKVIELKELKTRGHIKQ